MAQTVSLTMPLAFVAIWSTGWIAARAAVDHADPLVFLSVRFLLAGMMLAAFAAWVAAPWPRDGRTLVHLLVAGALIHGLYLAGVWWAVGQGVPAGISGLLATLQPLMTVVLAPLLLAERVGPRQVAGVALGMMGVVAVLSPQLADSAGAPLGWPLAVNTLAMVAVTAGTFYQKRFLARVDLRTGTAVQYAGALGVTAPLAVILEAGRFDVTAGALITLAWSVLVLSMAGIGIMLTLINRGAVSAVANLNFLVPGLVAAQAAVLFGETLTAVQIAGMVFASLGVFLAHRGRS